MLFIPGNGIQLLRKREWPLCGWQQTLEGLTTNTSAANVSFLASVVCPLFRFPVRRSSCFLICQRCLHCSVHASSGIGIRRSRRREESWEEMDLFKANSISRRIKVLPLTISHPESLNGRGEVLQVMRCGQRFGHKAGKSAFRLNQFVIKQTISGRQIGLSLRVQIVIKWRVNRELESENLRKGSRHNCRA